MVVVLLVALAVEFEVAVGVSVAGVAVGPVDGTAEVVGFEVAFEGEGVAFAGVVEAGCEVDVVGDFDDVAVGELDEEALVAGAFVVVREEFDDGA